MNSHLNRRDFIRAGSLVSLGALLPLRAAESRSLIADVCVYAGNAAGIAAAVAAAREGCRVLVVEPSRWLGGMTGSGLVHIDWGRSEAAGGSAKKILKDGLTDPQYRRMFAALAKQHGVEILYEHRVASAIRPRPTMARDTVMELTPARAAIWRRVGGGIALRYVNALKVLKTLLESYSMKVQLPRRVF